MQKYVFRDDVPLIFKGASTTNPQAVGEAIERIRLKHGPDEVIDNIGKDLIREARPKNHPAHGNFDWDNDVCGDLWRLKQARDLIRAIRIVDRSASEGTTRAFISVRSDTGRSYRSAGEIKKSVHLQELVMAQAQRDLEAFERRYRELKEICILVGKAREALQRRRGRADSRATAA